MNYTTPYCLEIAASVTGCTTSFPIYAPIIEPDQTTATLAADTPFVMAVSVTCKKGCWSAPPDLPRRITTSMR